MLTDEELKALKDRHAAGLWRNRAVCGIDVGNDAAGNPAFTVYLREEDQAVREGLPSSVEGCPVTYVYNPIEKQA